MTGLRQRTVTAGDAGDEALRQLYETAFPAEEQIPWPDLMRLIGEMPLDFTAYHDDNGLVGLTIIYPHEPFTWFWYFTVADGRRGRGLGQEILTALLSRYRGRDVVLDMESPLQSDCLNRAQRLRRHRFYSRNGFRGTGVYRRYGDIEYTIMLHGGGTFTMSDYDDIIAALHRHWRR